MRLAMLTCEQPWQRALAARLARQHELVLLCVDQHFSGEARLRRALRLLRQPARFAAKVRERAAIGEVERAAAQVYRDFFTQLGAPPFAESARTVLAAPDINAPEVAQAIAAATPDAIIVSGTRLIRPPVLDCAARYGMINLHTGLSPYYRGGPCTFWSLYHEEPEYAGATVHYITSGIDSGDIILSGRPALDAADNAASLDCKVIDLGQQLLLRALGLLAAGRAPRVPQWERGRVFLYKSFTVPVRLELEAKLRAGLMPRCLARLAEHLPDLRTIDA